MDELSAIRSALKGRYDVKRQLGQGGMASVYLADDEKHHRQVAIKVLRPDLASLLGPARFLREIEIEARLQHPNILPLHDSGEAEGLLYYVMPFVEGESLRQRLNREPQLPLEEALRITHEIADALAYAHSRGVVHRDVKPENILISNGHAVLADFGIARAVSEAGGDRVTETGHSVGTPAYMSPEQAAGETELDTRTDIYSLGCVLYEMLAGEPPFTGRTAQAVIAKQIAQPAPSLEITRPSLPAHVVKAVDKSLAKAAADRFATTEEFAAALETPLEEEKARRIWAVAAALLVAAVVTGVILWQVLRPEVGPLDPNKVVVFPLVDLWSEEASPEAGWDVAITIGTGLEHAQPLKWIDGWRWISEPMRQNPRLITPTVARDVCRRKGAHYYVDGVIRRVQETVAVVLRLHDVEGDSLVAQETSSGEVSAAALPDMGLRAITRLLPRLLDPGRRVDLSGLTQRQTSAIALWLQGEREYRQARLVSALDHYERAVELDSAFAFAALKGAQAASWKNRYDRARRLSDLAVAHDSILPPKYQHLAHGFKAYLAGMADSAVSRFKMAMGEDPDWAEAAVALAETYYHFLPSEAYLDSLAIAWFDSALSLDTAFALPMVHLAEAALRRGQLGRVEELMSWLRAVEPDARQLRDLTLALDCVQGGPSQFVFDSLASEEAVTELLLASKTLSAAASMNACAKLGFGAVLASANATVPLEWSALQGLQGLLIAEGRYEEARVLIDSAKATMPQAMMLHVFDAIVGHVSEPRLASVMEPEAEKAAQFARDYTGDSYESAQPRTLWLMGAWHAQRGETELAERLSRMLEDRARESGGRHDRLLADALAAHVIFAGGDTTLAIERLRALTSTGWRLDLGWELEEPLALERLLLAELLLARREYEEAYRVASIFDHQEPIMFLPCVRASLLIRQRAAVALGWPGRAAQARERLEVLGGTGDLDL